MEDNEDNNELISKAITDPEATIQSLDKAKEAIEQLMNTKKEAEATIEVGAQNEAEDSATNSWTEEDTADELMFKITGGYTYYKLPWSVRNRSKADNNRYYINDEDGKTIETTNAEGVIDYANTVFNYDMADNNEEELKTFDQAKSALENEGNFKIVNVNDTNQLSLFPKKENKPEEKENTVISNMDPMEYQNLLDRLGNRGWVVKKAVDLLKDGKGQEAYRELRRFLDVLKEDTKKIEENFVNTEIFRIIADSETPKIRKSDVLDYIKNNKYGK